MSATARSAATIERKVLSEAFQEVLAGRRLAAAVFLTFRFDPGFFEQEVLPIFFDIPLSHAPQVRLLHLEQVLREAGPIAVYFDRRALEAGAAPPRTDFQRVGVSHGTGYFHPKNVLLLVNDADAASGPQPPSRLIVASLSANLTRAGWWENVEVAHVEQVEPGVACGFRDDLLSLIAVVRRSSPREIRHHALDQIEAFMRRTEQHPQRLHEGRLVPRLFSGDRNLADFLDDLAARRLRGRCLEVISPYFDETESTKPLRALMERFQPRETRVFLPRGAAGEALCSPQYWQAIRDANASWATLPEEVVQLSRGTNRFVHAKVYRFFAPEDRRETFFVGSVNLTNAGFGKGGNVESGFVVEREGKRKSDWWLEEEARRPATFVSAAEDDGLRFGPGANLVLRFAWRTELADAFWDASEASPPLALGSAGVSLGAIGPLEPRLWTQLPVDLGARLKAVLPSSSFVTVAIAGEPDATILVDEEEATHKPSLLTTLSADEILRFWSLLTPEQKQEFLEEHADEIDDQEVALWIGDTALRPVGEGIFGTFAHLYLSFANLERAVRRALAEGRSKEAVDRLFGRKFDSLRRLVQRVGEAKEPDPVRAYVTLLCALQLLEVLRREMPDFHASSEWDPDLALEARAVAEVVKGGFVFAGADERRRFFGWLERWFLERATPAMTGPAA